MAAHVSILLPLMPDGTRQHSTAVASDITSAAQLAGTFAFSQPASRSAPQHKVACLQQSYSNKGKEKRRARRTERTRKKGREKKKRRTKKGALARQSQNEERRVYP